MMICFLSCGKPDTAIYEYRSESGNVHITLEGKRNVSKDPWEVKVLAESPGRREAKLKTEINSNVLSDHTILIDRTDDDHITLKILQTDGKEKYIDVILKEDKVELKEL